ncbi:MAG: hypothetical protein HY926_03100 [Elusimicrobia bacterium]|nr:hypothetical protein [Elusimicrobiota bacterium]
MEFEELRVFVGNELKRRFWEHRAMPAFSRGRLGMDGWLRVELSAILAERDEVEPSFRLPKGRAAVRAGGWLVEAVSLPTDFAFAGTGSGPKSLADDVKDLRKLIKRLRKGRGQDRAAVFLAVYPFGDLHEKTWAPHKARIEKALGGPLSEDRFSFQSGVTGRLCAGQVIDKVKPAPKPQPAEKALPARPKRGAAPVAAKAQPLASV